MLLAVSLVIKKQKYSIFDSVTGWLNPSRHLQYIEYVSFFHLIIISLSIACKIKSVEFLHQRLWTNDNCIVDPFISSFSKERKAHSTILEHWSMAVTFVEVF